MPGFVRILRMRFVLAMRSVFGIGGVRTVAARVFVSRQNEAGVDDRAEQHHQDDTHNSEAHNRNGRKRVWSRRLTVVIAPMFAVTVIVMTVVIVSAMTVIVVAMRMIIVRAVPMIGVGNVPFVGIVPGGVVFIVTGHARSFWRKESIFRVGNFTLKRDALIGAFFDARFEIWGFGRMR